MRLKAVSLVLLLSPFFYGLPNAAAADGANTSEVQVRKAIAEGYRQWISAVQKKDVNAVAALYTEDAVMLPPNQPAVSGREAIRHFYEDFYRSPGTLLNEEFTTTSLELRGDMAIETADFSGDVQLPDKGKISFKGKNLVVWQKQKNGAWMLFRDAWNSSSAAAKP